MSTAQHFVPVAIDARYGPPKAVVSRDGSASWLRRARPIVIAHRWMFGSSLVLSFVGLVIQVIVPLLIRDAIDNSLVLHRVALAHYVTLIIGLGVLFAIVSYVSRLLLMRTAYAMEFDLRNMLYEHLTRMSFGFYDRVQSGQLISRANSDIRSVQMYLTFGAGDPRAVLDRGRRVRLHADDQRPARVRRDVDDAVRVLARRADAALDVPGVVADPVAAGGGGDDRRREHQRRPRRQVVRRRAARADDARQAPPSALQWSYIKDADLRARFTPAVQNLPQLGLALILVVGGLLVIHGHLGVGTILAFSAYV